MARVRATALFAGGRRKGGKERQSLRGPWGQNRKRTPSRATAAVWAAPACCKTAWRRATDRCREWKRADPLRRVPQGSPGVRGGRTLAPRGRDQLIGLGGGGDVTCFEKWVSTAAHLRRDPNLPSADLAVASARAQPRQGGERSRAFHAGLGGQFQEFAGAIGACPGAASVPMPPEIAGSHEPHG